MASSSFQVRPHGSFRTGFDLLGPTGTPVGTFDGSVWRERGRVRAGGGEWEFRKERGRTFVLVGPAGDFVSADRTSFWTDRWQVSVGGWGYALSKPGWWSRRYELKHGDQVVGELTPKGVLGNRAEVSLPAAMPPEAMVFVVALVLTLWRRESAAAS